VDGNNNDSPPVARTQRGAPVPSRRLPALTAGEAFLYHTTSSSTKVTFKITLNAEILLFSICTSCSLTHALLIWRSVFDARSTPRWIASSKLILDVEVISTTRATDMTTLLARPKGRAHSPHFINYFVAGIVRCPELFSKMSHSPPGINAVKSTPAASTNIVIL
jgi:hypothetical protein